MTNRISVLLLAAALAAPSAVDAQRRSATSGLNLGIGLQTAWGDFDDDFFSDGDIDPGGGLDLHIGYNFTPRFGLLIAGSAAEVSGEGEMEFGLANLDFLGRFIFSDPDSRFIPYIDVGGGWVVALADDDVGVERELSGPALVAGAGLDFFIWREFAIEGELKFARGELDRERIGNTTVERENGPAVSTGRFKLGVAWYPLASR